MVDEVPARVQRHTALNIWAACVAILLGPSSGVGGARRCAGGALRAGSRCLPGHGAGRRFARRALLAWSVSTDTTILISVALIAAVAALFARRPLISALSFCSPPVADPADGRGRPFAMYQGCLSEAGIGDCTLWGAQMGMSYRRERAGPGSTASCPIRRRWRADAGPIGMFDAARPASGRHRKSGHSISDDRFRQRLARSWVRIVFQRAHQAAQGAVEIPDCEQDEGERQRRAPSAPARRPARGDCRWWCRARRTAAEPCSSAASSTTKTATEIQKTRSDCAHGLHTVPRASPRLI